MRGSARIRVVIVGTGMIGSAHVRAARAAGAEVIGVLGSSVDRSIEAAAQLGVSVGFDNFKSVLAARPDVIHICTPNSSHLEYALAAIGAGINVVVEKPIATSLSDARVLSDAVKSAGVVATVPYVYRYHPLVREIRARRIAGELGEIALVHGSYLQDWLLNPHSSSWRVDANLGGASRAFADIGTHWCDLAEFVSGERARQVVAATTITYPERPVSSRKSFSGGEQIESLITVTTEDTAVATFVTERDITMNAVISQVSAGRKNRLWLEVDGTIKSAVFDQEEPDSILIGSETGTLRLHRAEGPNLSPDQVRLNRTPPGHPQGWTDAFASFCADTYDAIRGGQPEGLPTVDDGLRSLEIVDAILRSASNRLWTDISATG